MVDTRSIARYCVVEFNQQLTEIIMKFKYFQITDKKTIEHIKEGLESISVREARLADLAKSFGALKCLVFSNASIAAFKFNYSERPDKDIWKKVKYGFMPKVKTNEHMRVIEIPKSIDYLDVIKQYGFGGEMIIGEHIQGRGFKMHSSYLSGNIENNFWAITVPYQEEFDRKIDDSLVALKKWEVTKGCDSSEH